MGDDDLRLRGGWLHGLPQEEQRPMVPPRLTDPVGILDLKSRLRAAFCCVNEGTVRDRGGAGEPRRAEPRAKRS